MPNMDPLVWKLVSRTLVWLVITLKRELEGYEAYAARVRSRLIPGIW